MLLKDIEEAAKSEQSHFVGSIVYFQPDTHARSQIDKYLVIDGQQRLTTITLLIAALVRFIEENPGCESGTTATKLKNYYLFNAEEEKGGDRYYKLLLTKRDKETLKNLLTNKPLPEDRSQGIVENHEYFRKNINEGNIDKIYEGLQKLIVLDVVLERGKDNPQAIFESLNAKGLKLTQVDLIKNYVLMDQEEESQKSLYDNWWYPMEQRFVEGKDSLPDEFMHDYLTMKLDSAPKTEEIYDAFKDYFKLPKDELETEGILKHLYKYSGYYVSIALLKEEDEKLRKVFKEIVDLKMTTSYPFLLEVYGDYDEGRITSCEFLDILHLTKSYVFRRSVCNISSRSLNTIFSTLYNTANTAANLKEVKNEAYVESVNNAFFHLGRDWRRRFPNDEEFKREIQSEDVSHPRTTSSRYLLESLENFGRKELVRIEKKEIQIEHIMPQTMSPEWKEELGENWEKVHNTYLHTLGNLTLNGYNPELSNKPFKGKKEIGFNKSPFYLNESVRAAEVWNEAAIKKRAGELAERALKIWPSPRTPE